MGRGGRDRSHFLAVWAQIVRRILVDYARGRRRGKRGGGTTPITLDEALAASPARDWRVAKVRLMRQLSRGKHYVPGALAAGRLKRSMNPR